MCTGRPLLVHGDYEKDGVKKRKGGLLTAAAAAEDGGGGGGGAEDADPIASHLKYLNLDKTSLREALVVTSVCDAQPLSSPSRLGASFLWRLLRLPPQPKSSLARAFEAMYHEWIKVPLTEAAAAATKLITVDVTGGYQYTLATQISCSADGWSRNGNTYESVIGHSYEVLRQHKDIPNPHNPALGKVRVPTAPQLLPSLFHIGLAHWMVGKYGQGGLGGYCANAHADLLRAVMLPTGQGAHKVREWIMDTTNGNPAVLKEPLWRHCAFVECAQHLLALAVQDAHSNVQAFKDALTSAQEMAKFLGASSRRMEALSKFTPLVPILRSATRFASALQVCQRTVQHANAFSLMHARVVAGQPLFNGDHAADSAATVESFKQLYAKLLPHMPVVEGLARLGKPFLSIIARLGSDTEYTSSIVQEAVRALFDACESERTAHPVMNAICLELQSSLLQRIASHATTSALLKPHHKVPDFLQPGPAQSLRLSVDSRSYAAQVLDPAYAHFVLLRPGSLEDAVSYFYGKILVPGAALIQQPPIAAPPAAPDSAAAFKQQLAAIDALPKPLLETPDAAWAECLATRHTRHCPHPPWASPRRGKQTRADNTTSSSWGQCHPH